MKKYLLSSIVICMIFTAMLIKANESVLPRHVKSDVDKLREKYETEDFWEQVTAKNRKKVFFVDPGHSNVFPKVSCRQKCTVSCPVQEGQEEVEVFIDENNDLFFKAHSLRSNGFIFGVAATAIVGKPSVGFFRGRSVLVTELAILKPALITQPNSNTDSIKQEIQKKIKVLRETVVYEAPLWKSPAAKMAATAAVGVAAFVALYKNRS